MGGDLLYRSGWAPGEAAAESPGESSDNYRFALTFTDGTRLTIRFWWFGHVHAVAEGAPADHAPTASLGPSPLDPELTPERFRAMVARKTWRRSEPGPPVPTSALSAGGSEARAASCRPGIPAPNRRAFGDDGPWPAAGAAVAPKLDKAWAALDDAPGCGKQKDPDEGWNEETRD
jgi:hypothetical protein